MQMDWSITRPVPTASPNFFNHTVTPLWAIPRVLRSWELITRTNPDTALLPSDTAKKVLSIMSPHLEEVNWQYKYWSYFEQRKKSGWRYTFRVLSDHTYMWHTWGSMLKHIYTLGTIETSTFSELWAYNQKLASSEKNWKVTKPQLPSTFSKLPDFSKILNVVFIHTDHGDRA